MSTHPLTRHDNLPMSSKTITTVVGILTLTPFIALGYNDAAYIKHNLQAQTQQIAKLSNESVKLDTKLAVTKQTKEQVQQENDKLEQQAQAAAAERAKLEAELSGAN